MSFDAYEVYYSTGGKTDSTKLLVKWGESVEEALSRKDSNFSTESRWCSINRKKQIPVNNVKISELSIGEFRMVLNSQ